MAKLAEVLQAVHQINMVETEVIFNSKPQQLPGLDFERYGKGIEMSQETKEKFQLANIPIQHIIPTQQTVDFSKVQNLKKTTKNDTGAYMLHYKGKYFIIDGHHRVAASIMHGYVSIKAYIYTIKD